MTRTGLRKHEWSTREMPIAIAIAIAACGETRRDDGIDDGADGIVTIGGDDDDDVTRVTAGEDAGETDGDAQATDDDGGGGGTPRFDVGVPAGGLPCGQGPNVGNEGAVEFSYIWIANSPENTISKINTQTLVEEGRYRTRETFGNPSRTSVALSGHVAVANRSGGVTKFYAHSCPDPLATSSGPSDVYPFGSDGCFAWSTAMQYDSQRPVAWTPGTFDDATCQWRDERLWTAGCVHAGGVCPSIDVLRLDGETGVILDEVTIVGVHPDAYGAYGGASDGEGNFWFSQLGDGRIGRVSAEDPQDVALFDMPLAGYGMAVDPSGRVWICGGGGVGRFTYETETWDTIGTFAAGGISFGCMADPQRMWLAGDSLRGIDLETMQLVYDHALPSFVRGTSVDFEGFVWGVSMDTRAYKVDPTTGAVQTYEGLNNPYSYSDMTGFGLSLSYAPQG